MKKQTILNATAILTFSSVMAFSLLTSCEGPQGIAGVDANESCKQCHNPEWVTAVSDEFDLSKHKYGEAAFEEAGNATCAPCHESEAFKYVVKNNIPSTFVLNTATPPKYANQYVATVGVAYGELSCGTCHVNLHTAYDSTDIYPLTTTAAVSMTMWAGTKEINLTADNGISNLCVKCHQPRPVATSTTLSDGNVVDYNALAASPAGTFFAFGDANNKVNPSYRTHVHYGTVGAVVAGKGGVEFTGTKTYESSAHTALASCQDCHMAAITGRSGGHTFAAKGNFNGCNTADCHGASPLTAKSTKITDTQAAHKTLLQDLGAKIVNADGIEILHKEKDAELNLWAGLTSKGYDGYLDIFDPSTNPDGVLQNPAPASSWSQANKDINTALPTFSLTNAQMGAIINFQFALREYSLGIHNGPYTKALLTNSIETLN
jgi:hypothetical protein